MSISATSLSQLFTLADTDKNNALKTSELEAVLADLPNAGHANAATALKNMDANGDGALSVSEFSDGVQLNEKVSNALLAAQELTSGSTLLTMLSGGKDAGGSGSLFTSLYGNTTDSAATDSYTALLEQVLAKYHAAEAETATDTTITTA